MVHWARAGIAIQHKLLMYANRQARERDGLLPRFRYAAAKKWVCQRNSADRPWPHSRPVPGTLSRCWRRLHAKAGMTSLGVIVDSARYSLEKIISSRGKTLMADESNTETTETAPPAEAAPPRKRRGPRPKNVVSDATAETPEAVAAQPMRGRRKRADRSAEAPALPKPGERRSARAPEKPVGQSKRSKRRLRSQSSTTLLIFVSLKKRTLGSARRWPKNSELRTPICASDWVLPDHR